MKKLIVVTLSVFTFCFGVKAQQYPTKALEIQSILVDACNFSSPEQDNEMFTFIVGPTALNITNLTLYGWQGNTGTTYTVNSWPSLGVAWAGLVQNAATSVITSSLQATITNGCGKLIEPPGGIIPAHASVLVVTSVNPSTTDNSFATLTDTLYIVYHNSTGGTAHFKNSYCVGSALSTTPCAFTSTTTATATRGMALKDNASGMSDTVTYQINLLTNNITATPYGGTTAENDGATVEYAWPGYPVATYVNHGCKAPFIPLSATASTTNTAICSNATASLTGTAGGTYTTTTWSGGTGTFGNIHSLNTLYTPGAGESGQVVLTLTVYGKCLGTTATSTVAITINAAPTPSITSSNGAAICNGSSTTLSVSSTGTLTTTWAWNPGGASTSTISVSPPTGTQIYTVTGTNTCGTAESTFTVTTNALPTINLVNDSICAGVANGTLNASGVSSYTWNNGVQTSSLTAAPGTYSVTGTDGNGCKSTVSASIILVSLPNITTNVNSICINATSTLTASGGTANSYTWSPGGPSGNNTYVVTPASNTPIVVTGAGTHGCLNTHTVTINATPTITVNDPSSCAGQAVILQASPSTLSTYTWTGVASSSSTASVAPGGTSSYTVAGTDANGCISNAAVSTVSITAGTQISITASSNPPCINSNYTLTANGASTYTWLPVGGYTSLDPPNNTQISVTQSTAAVTFTVSGTGSCPATPTVVTINPAPVTTLTISSSNNAQVCYGGTVTISASGANSYTWNPPSITNGVAFTPTVSGVSVYSVTAIDAYGCTVDSSVSITVNNLPVLSVFSKTICPSSTATLTATSGSTISTYTWSTGSTADTTIVSPSVNSNYTVSATDGNGCVGTTTASVNIVNSLTVTTLATNSLSCSGSLDTLIAYGGQSYTWTASNGSTTSISANKDTVTINPTVATTYTVKGSSGTCSDSATVTVNIAPPINITVASNPTNDTICMGGNITLSGSGAVTYTWTSGVIDNTPFSPTSSQTYTVVGTNAQGCTGRDTVAVVVNSLPVINISALPAVSICLGQSATLTATGAAVTSYTWSTTDITSTITVTPVTAGTQTYAVVGTSTNSCTNASAPTVITVTVNTPPTITIASNPTSSSVCAGSTATLTASSSSPLTYTWVSISANNPISVNPTIKTTYTVIGTDGNNCSNLDTITININPLPIAQTITAGSPIVCIGAINPPVILSVPNPGTWVGPAPSTATISANSASISVTHGGVYTLLTTNNCGNAPSAPYTLVADSVIANFTANPLTGQTPVTVTYTNTSVALGGNTLSYNWGFGDGNSSISTNPTNIFTGAATYQTTLTATDNLGCKDTATIYIVVKVVPPIIIIPNIFTPNGDNINDMFSIDATGINNFDCKVYDRWGLLLHEWQGVNGGWDGKARNGDNCTDGTYFYLITYIDNYNKSTIKDGFFQLIR